MRREKRASIADTLFFFGKNTYWLSRCMDDYVELLRKDLVEQFKEKPVIDALIEAVGQQLNDVARFYEDLRDKRGLHTSEGRQIDGIGDIVVLSRLEAGELACVKEPAFVLDGKGGLSVGS